jgi:hypothetical protein
VGVVAWGEWLKRRKTLSVLVLVLAVLVAGSLVWVAVDDEACWDAPPEVAAWARDPQAATTALDPGEDLSRAGRIEGLFSEDHWVTCDGPSGPELLGGVLVAATTGRTAEDQDAPAVRHSLPMARVLHQAVVTLGAAQRLPEEFAPYVAQAAAAYIVDISEAIDTTFDPDDEDRRQAIVDERTGEARPRFTAGDAPVLVRGLMTNLAADPEAYAVLYDALRAWFAHYLDHLAVDGRGTLTAGVGTPPEHAFAPGSVGAITDGLTLLAYWRAAYIETGVVEDGGAFDQAVLEHSRGAYMPAAKQPSSIASEGVVPQRDATAAGRGEGLLDPRQQLRGAVEQWAADRGVPAVRAEAITGLVDSIYLRSVRGAVLTDYDLYGQLP